MAHEFGEVLLLFRGFAAAVFAWELLHQYQHLQRRFVMLTRESRGAALQLFLQLRQLILEEIGAEYAVCFAI